VDSRNQLMEQIQRGLERDRELEHAQKLAKIRAGSEHQGESGADAPIIWLGNERDFASFIIKQFDDGKIQAKSRSNALAQACRYFVRKDGTKIKKMIPRYLLQNYQNKLNSD
jgi:hypothetical protein